MHRVNQIGDHVALPTAASAAGAAAVAAAMTPTGIPSTTAPASQLQLHPDRRRLTEIEIAQYNERGYVYKLPVFSAEGVSGLQDGFARLTALFERQTGRAGAEISRVNMWHKANRWVHDLCRTDTILDIVEDILGPNFTQWGAHFFVKYPGDGTVVPYHQE